MDENIEVTPRNSSGERAAARLLFLLHFHSFLDTEEGGKCEGRTVWIPHRNSERVKRIWFYFNLQAKSLSFDPSSKKIEHISAQNSFLFLSFKSRVNGGSRSHPLCLKRFCCFLFPTSQS